MKSFVILALLVAAAVAAPASPASSSDANAQVVENNVDNIGVEGYRYNYKTSNGIAHSEEGVLKNQGLENEAIEVRGQFSYVGVDGVTYTVLYLANENGFQPSGDHLPKDN